MEASYPYVLLVHRLGSITMLREETVSVQCRVSIFRCRYPAFDYQILRLRKCRQLLSTLSTIKTTCKEFVQFSVQHHFLEHTLGLHNFR